MTREHIWAKWIGKILPKFSYDRTSHIVRYSIYNLHENKINQVKCTVRVTLPLENFLLFVKIIATQVG